VQFNVLGPLKVLADTGAPVTVAKSTQRETLTVLLVLGGPQATRDRLAAALWGDQRRSPATLRSRIWELRGIPAVKDRLETADRVVAYRLRVEPDELDASRFASLAARGRSALAAGDPEAAARLLEEAAGLWRGEPPWADWPRTPLMEEAADRLGQLQAETMEAWQQARLELGRYRDVVGPLREVVAANPIREHAWVLLITALARAGHTAEALAEYANARAAIVSELGQDPGPELQHLAQRLRAGDSAFSPALLGAGSPASLAPVPVCQLPAAVADFIGRDAETETVGRHLASSGGTVPVVVVTGPAGAGKTALALQCAHQVHESFPGGQLYARLTEGIQRRSPHDVLAEILRALGVPPADIPAAAREREALYRSLLAYRKVLVVADGAADATQVRPLLPGTPGSAVLVTSRSRLPGLEAAHLVEVGDLPAAEAASLVRHIAGPGKDQPETGEAFAAIADSCGCLALALRIAGDRLATEPALTPAALASALTIGRRRLLELTSGDLALSTVLSDAYDALGEPARRAFRLTSLHPSDDIPGWLIPVLLADPDAVGVAEALASAGLLTAAPEPGPAPHRYRIHPLSHVFAAWQLGVASLAERTAATGRMFSGWLDLADHADRQIPRHPYAPAPASLQRSAAIPESACAVITGQPSQWFAREAANLEAVTLEACGHDPPLAAALAARQFSAQLQRGAFAAAAGMWTAVAAAAERTDDRLARARARYRLAIAMLAEDRYDRHAVGVLTSCLEAFGSQDRVGRADTLHLLALCAIDDGDPAAAQSRAEEGLAVAREEGNPRLVFLNQSALGIVIAGLGDTARGIRHCEEALSIATELGESAYTEAAGRALDRARIITPGSWQWRNKATAGGGFLRQASA
jgi:DNA-binding SARP family transcriptional activator